MKRIIPVVMLLAACGGDTSSTQCKAMLIPGDLVITEILADYAAPAGSSGADTGKEWFEIYNASSRPVDLQGVVLTLSRPDGTASKSHTMTEATIAPGQYFTLGDVDPAQLPAWVDYGYGSDLGEMFNTNGGKLAIACNGTEVDHAIYSDVKSGFTQQFDGQTAPDYTANDDLARWCQADTASSTEYDPSNFGTPRAANQGCMVVTTGMCNDNGTQRTTVPPGVGDLVITEIMPSPSKVSDTTGEWFEVLATKDVDLNGVGLDRAGDSSKANVIMSTDCVHVATGAYAIFAKSTDTTMNGMLPPPAGTFTFSMVAGSTTTPGDVQVIAPDGTTVVDAVTWTKSSSGKALALDPDFSTADANDMTQYWCDATTPYGAGDLGTPAAVNAHCTILPPPGMCNDGGTLRAIKPPAAGEIKITEWMPDPAKVADTAGEWLEVQAKADIDLNGLQLGSTTLGTTSVVVSADCVKLANGGFALFARNIDMTMNGGLPAVDGKFTFSLANSNGTAQVGVGGVTLDTVTWATAKSGTSIQIDGAAKQCNAPTGTAAYNGTDIGTPKAAFTTACP